MVFLTNVYYEHNNFMRFSALPTKSVPKLIYLRSAGPGLRATSFKSRNK